MRIRRKIIDARYELNKARERALVWVVWHTPRPLIYWAVIRAGSEATTGKHADQVVPELTILDTLDRWKGIA